MAVWIYRCPHCQKECKGRSGLNSHLVSHLPRNELKARKDRDTVREWRRERTAHE